MGDALAWLNAPPPFGAGVWAQRCNSGAVKTKRSFVRFGLGHGCADVIAIVDGRFLALEFKRPGERPEPHQTAWGRAVEAHGGLYRVVTCLSEVRKALIEARSNAA